MRRIAISRTSITRVKTLGALVVLGAVLLGTTPWENPRHTISVEQLRDNFYLLKASGMNVAALVTDDGVVLVDTMPDGWWGPAILSTIQGLTSQPITTIINTHSHQDHVGNLALLKSRVTDVVIQTNGKNRIGQEELSDANKAAVVSSTSYTDTMSLVRGDHRIDLHHYGAGHTDNDSWVVFPSLGIMHIGDLAWKDDAPSFMRNAGGSGVAYPETVAKGLAALKGIDTIIVGHGYDDNSRPVMSRRELEALQRQATQMVSVTRRALQQGKSATEAAQLIRSTEGFETFTEDRVQRAVQAIYDELKECADASGESSNPVCEDL